MKLHNRANAQLTPSWWSNQPQKSKSQISWQIYLYCRCSTEPSKCLWANGIFYTKNDTDHKSAVCLQNTYRHMVESTFLYISYRSNMCNWITYIPMVWLDGLHAFHTLNTKDKLSSEFFPPFLSTFSFPTMVVVCMLVMSYLLCSYI